MKKDNISLDKRKLLIQKHSLSLNKLLSGCTHKFRRLTDAEKHDQWMSVSAVCEVCRKDFGWRCKDSPDKVCHYLSEPNKWGVRGVTLMDGSFFTLKHKHDPEYEGYDSCIFCGLPDERK